MTVDEVVKLVSNTGFPIFLFCAFLYIGSKYLPKVINEYKKERQSEQDKFLSYYESLQSVTAKCEQGLAVSNKVMEEVSDVAKENTQVLKALVDSMQAHDERSKSIYGASIATLEHLRREMQEQNLVINKKGA